MRWSLILSALIAVQSALSFVCVALAIPGPQSDELERREPAGGIKIPSKQYRTHAKEHPYAYHVENLGSSGKITQETKVTKEKLKKGDRTAHANKLLGSSRGKYPLHADHVFEAQMLEHHFKEHNVNFKDMDPKLQHKVKGILNGRNNMALIPGSINQSKGQLIKHGMLGKKIKRQKARDQYALLSYGTAHKTAGKLDEALKDHKGYTAAVHGNTLQQKLHDTFVKAGLHPGSRPSSRPSSPSSGSSSAGSKGRSNSRQSSSKPSTPVPSSPNRRRTTKRKASPGNSNSAPNSAPNSPPKNRQRTGKKRGGRK